MPPKIKIDRLKEAPKGARSAVARGFGIGPALAVGDDRSPIVRDGGLYNSGLIQGFAVITRGEALGHGLWIDEEFLNQTAKGLGGEGVRARFTHPNMSSDGIARKLGRVRLTAQDGDIVRGDLHFSQSSHTTPDGDLAAYVMGLAEEDPDLFGASIAFDRDYDAEVEFLLAHGAEEKHDPYWGKYLDLSEFESPDPKNTSNLPHARLLDLRAVDIVDEPAANPGGMFHATTIPAEADALAAYVLGLSNDAPACEVLAGIDADRMRGFASRFIAQHGIKLTIGEGNMPKLKTGDPTQETESTTSDEGATTEPEATTPEGGGQVATDASSTEPEATTEPVAEPTAEEQMSAKFNRYVETFGAENGPKWFAEKASFEECLGRQVALLNAQNKELQSKLSAAVAANGEEPVSSTPEGAEPAKAGGKFSGLSEGQARFAAGIKLPTK